MGDNIIIFSSLLQINLNSVYFKGSSILNTIFTSKQMYTNNQCCCRCWSKSIHIRLRSWEFKVLPSNLIITTVQQCKFTERQTVSLKSPESRTDLGKYVDYCAAVAMFSLGAWTIMSGCIFFLTEGHCSYMNVTPLFQFRDITNPTKDNVHQFFNSVDECDNRPFPLCVFWIVKAGNPCQCNYGSFPIRCPTSDQHGQHHSAELRPVLSNWLIHETAGVTLQRQL